MKWYESSTGSGDLSLTIKGILTAFVPLIILAAQALGKEVTSTQIDEFVAVIVGAISALMIAFGAVRKIIMAFKKP